MRHTIVVMVVIGALAFGVVLNVLPKNEFIEHVEHPRHIETPSYQGSRFYLTTITSSGSYEPVNPFMSSHST